MSRCPDDAPGGTTGGEVGVDVCDDVDDEVDDEEVAVEGAAELVLVVPVVVLEGEAPPPGVAALVCVAGEPVTVSVAATGDVPGVATVSTRETARRPSPTAPAAEAAQSAPKPMVLFTSSTLSPSRSRPR